MLDELYNQGQAADLSLAREEFEEAGNAYRAILAALRQADLPDPYLLAKLALSSILLEVRRQDYEAAVKIWKASPQAENADLRWLSQGVAAIARGVLSTDDTVLFCLLEAAMHQETRDQKDPIEAVNTLMQSVCELLEDEHPQQLPQALSNWQLHLQQLAAEEQDKQALGRFLARSHRLASFEEPVFPNPDRWKPGPPLETPEPAKPALAKTHLDSSMPTPTWHWAAAIAAAILVVFLVSPRASWPKGGQASEPTQEEAGSQNPSGQPRLSLGGINIATDRDSAERLFPGRMAGVTLISDMGAYTNFTQEGEVILVRHNVLTLDKRTLLRQGDNEFKVSATLGEPSERDPSRGWAYLFSDNGWEYRLLVQLRREYSKPHQVVEGFQLSPLGLRYTDHERISLNERVGL